MSTHNICFRREIRKISAFFQMKKAPYLLLCRIVNYQILLLIHSQENGLNRLVQLKFTCPKIKSFLISQRIHMLWLLNRSTSLSTHNICFL